MASPKGRSHFEWSEQLGLFRQPGPESKLQHTVWARPPTHRVPGHFHAFARQRIGHRASRFGPTLRLGSGRTITVRLVVRRVKDARYPDALFPVWRYHPFVTNTDLSTTEADLTHRRHAIIETTFADLIDGPGIL